MAINLNFLKEITNIEQMSGEPPDGGIFCIAKAQGNMDLGSNIKLSNVLYILSFHCSLFLNAQLSRELKCIMIFAEELCVA